ncbi:bifunctional diguanylate cyclase/phosphodiesterase [Salipaludibacillus agaradhaerens]|nr:bifunctional diguanylate cyclase/phosphodiesterase [Salipaludibacillus agaradhaerens]
MPMEESFNFYIVALSIAISIFASYSALSIVAKVSASQGKMRCFWLLSGSFVMGAGIWAMHFVGMIAVTLHVPVTYDVKLTLLSLVVSVSASLIAFIITLPKSINFLHVWVGGLVIGSGIITMHYIGMEAMIMPKEMSHSPGLFSISVTIALIASYVALFLFIKWRDQTGSSWLKWLSAVIMGLAICGMHYTSILATQFHPHSEVTDIVEEAPLNIYLLSAVTLAIFLILVVSWVIIFFDRHVLAKLAYSDTITGLPNRNDMHRYFQSLQEREVISLLLIDLDQFKAINDTLGHDTGDILVKYVGLRLEHFTDHNHHAFRIGGDSFLIIIRHHSKTHVESIANDLLTSLQKPHFIEGNELRVTASIGISIGPVHLEGRSTLLQRAETAMYQAKAAGKNQYCIYNEDMGKGEVRKFELQKDLQSALDYEQFYLVYQPKWNTLSHSLIGFEALIRWHHPRDGLISPGEFIPIAEESSYIIPLTKWILKTACIQAKQWDSEGYHLPVSVNLSSSHFRADNVAELVRTVLNETELSPHLLELEITESMMLYDLNNVIEQLQAIRSLGVKIAMDDFGTGYSSIGLLDQIPLDTLKLDRVFTRNIDTKSKRAIVRAIILMAESLQIQVIAEGVETQEHVDYLTQLGCHYMQGYFYAKPMKVSDINEWLPRLSANIE